ncbi:MAG: hypothetical protein ABII90_12270, partial [Bacteroidota bacterium]
KMVYGGTGHPSGCAPPFSCIPSDFMFPGDTDPCGWGTEGIPQTELWTEQTSGNTPDDRRFVHSAGPFTLEPGATNDITVGVVWSRAVSTDPFQSVELVRLADDKAQALFDNCFKVLNGPDAPELMIQEFDRELILYITNPASSLNYMEQYVEKDPMLIEPDSYPGTFDDKYYFQGYQIFQLNDASVSVADLQDFNLARLVAQCDVKDSVGKIVNFEYNEELGADVPTLMVDGEDMGIRHSFQVTEDLFAMGDKRLVNHKTYYFLAIAYAYNQFKVYTYDPVNPEADGNKKPYLAGRKDGYSQSISSVPGIPHKPEVEENGTQINSQYGDGPEITRIEGQGNGGLVIDLTQETIDEIMSGPPWRVDNPVYQRRKGPVDVKVIDPLNVKGGNYVIKFFYDDADTIPIVYIHTTPDIICGASYFEVSGDIRNQLETGDKFYVSGSTENDGTYTVQEITDGGTYIIPEEYISSGVADGVIYPFYKWALIDGDNMTDTLFVFDQSVKVGSEQLVMELGISITIEQVLDPGPAVCVPHKITSGLTVTPGLSNPDPNNGFLEATMTFADNDYQWLTGVVDGDAPNATNWIRSGTSDEPNFQDYSGFDNNQIYENILGGIWAPYRLCSKDSLSPAFNYKQNSKSDIGNIASIDLVITADKSKWTRSVVIEQQENINYSKPLGSEIEKFSLREHPSVNTSGVASGGNTTDPTSSNYIDSVGMGWFPGYAINVETGERLNIMFGEDSWSVNGNDLIWNPTSDLSSPLGQAAIDFGIGQPGVDGIPYWAGGKHYIYIVGHNGDDTTNIAEGRGDIPSYDAGAYIREVLSSNLESRKAGVYKDVIWVSIPLLEQGFEFNNPENIPTDVTIRLRVAKPFKRNYSTDSVYTVSHQNDNNPMYSFNLDEFEPRTGVDTIAKNALDLINVVPNPYYAFSFYETSQIDHRIKIINLPVNCTVSIYNIGGTLIRKFDRDDHTITSIDWDLKNSYNVPIASGVYLIHVNAPGIGEKVVKWFGVLRPIDLDSF